MSDIQQLTAAGQAIYGNNWQNPLARDLDVDGRTMRFWVAGERPVPDGVRLKLPGILRQAARDRRRAAEAIERLAETVAA